MNKRDKTITFKGKGSLFIPRNIIRSEYPESNNNEGGNNENNLILNHYYRPDALIVRLSQEDYNLPIEYEIVENLTQFIEGVYNGLYTPFAHCAYKDNTLNLLQCFDICNYGGDGATFAGASSGKQFRKYKDTEYYYIDEYPLDE